MIFPRRALKVVENKNPKLSKVVAILILSSLKMAGYLLLSDAVMDPVPRCKFYFSEFEKDLLRQLYEKNKDVLKWKSGVSPMRVREKGWADLCTKYNNTAGVRWRNVKQIKKFIENMTQRDKRLARLSGNSLTSGNIFLLSSFL